MLYKATIALIIKELSNHVLKRKMESRTSFSSVGHEMTALGGTFSVGASGCDLDALFPD